MTKEELLKKYQEWVRLCSAYRMALAIIGIDKLTVAPPGGNAYRDERTAILAGELFSIETDPEMLKVLEALQQEDLDGDTRRAVDLYAKELNKFLRVPKEEYVAFQHLKDESYNAWLSAKQADDYSIFEPYMKKLIEMSRKQYGYRQSDMSLYDQMLDDYEPGMTMAAYDGFFDLIKERIVPLIKEVTEAGQINDSFLYQDYPVAAQKQFMDSILKYLRFDPEWGYQNETEHPFTSWTCENDCRTTTKYLPDNVISAILSTVHEVGHATYEHDIAPAYDGMILSEGVSSGMHESQSRLLENYLGRTLPFWQYHYPELQKTFPQQLGNVTCEEFVQAVNAAQPSPVRTEADELTYPIHILIRYEIEKGLFTGTISPEHLDETWNRMYKEYLGIDITSAREGILQDVHWSDASFGYFPTYALGSAFAAQFMQAMRKDLDVDELLRSGRFDEIVSWLKEHIHQYGCRYDAEEILKKCTGEGFHPLYYVTYLEDKYRALYHLKGDRK